jgi:alpha-D-ribose 1-methylphosphonate 5-triphosphate synthase subunit PhnL
MKPAIEVIGLAKSFTLHVQGGVNIPVLERFDMEVYSGECVALHGPSGSGKSSLLRSLYANYKPQSGSIMVRHRGRMVDMARAEPREVIDVRRCTMGFVSQFLRVIPRVPAIKIVAEPLRSHGVDCREAEKRAGSMLDRLRIPKRLWSLAPATFSGGEQQRINIARGFIAERPVMLLDEPTASLDMDNRLTVIELIREARERGAALVGIFHDAEVRDAVSDRIIDMGLKN